MEGVLQMPADILALRQGEADSAFVQAVWPQSVALEACA
jgi:hypothetical protein